jgi:hypothetical protein
LSSTAALAVEHGHLACVVAVAGGGVGGHRALDRGEVVGVQVEVQRPQRLGQPVAPARPDQRHDVRAAGQRPADRDLRDGGAFGVGDGAQPLDQREVAIEILPAEAGGGTTEVALRQGAPAGPVAAEQAARQHAVGGHRHAERAAGGQDLGLDPA